MSADLVSRLVRPNGFHAFAPTCECGWLRSDCDHEQAIDGDASGHERRLEEFDCPHALTELLSINGRNLENAQRTCAHCGEVIANSNLATEVALMKVGML